MRLSDLADLKIEEKQFVRGLASLAGDRLEVRVDRLRLVPLGEAARERPNGRKVLPAFPPGAQGLRTQRWLNRRRFPLLVGWYLFAVVPALLLTGFAARLHELARRCGRGAGPARSGRRVRPVRHAVQPCH